ncbi:hypothetical protein GCM10009530_32520 [Microbispora corallina]|uniref:Uncharacterized protein n=1 Tax=Microbispora corallina TaxID=83302 RepID=A0ABQ4GBW9_9ACTN|nr:hypothetical protein Mco01_75420 [Microbispora corallina]
MTESSPVRRSRYKGTAVPANCQGEALSQPPSCSSLQLNDGPDAPWRYIDGQHRVAAHLDPGGPGNPRATLRGRDREV